MSLPPLRPYQTRQSQLHEHLGIFSWYGSTATVAHLSKAYMSCGGNPLILSQAVFAVGALPCIIALPLRTVTKSVGWEIIALSTLQCCNDILTNIALGRTSITFVYLIRSLELPFTFTLHYALEKDTPELREGLLLATISVCILVAIVTHSGHWTSHWSTLMCLWCTYMSSSRNLLFKTKASVEPTMDPLQKLSIISLGSLLLSTGFLTLFGTPAWPQTLRSDMLAYGAGAVCLTLASKVLALRTSTGVTSIAYGSRNSARRLVACILNLLWVSKLWAPFATLSLCLVWAHQACWPASGSGRSLELSPSLKRSFSGLWLTTSVFIALASAGGLLSPPQHTHIISTGYRFNCMAENQTANPRLYQWKIEPPEADQNFGDELSSAIVERILGHSVSIFTEESSSHLALMAVGSIAQHARQCDILWGTGVRDFASAPSKIDMDIRALRGPLSRNLIMKLNPGLHVPEVYGDPALLMPVLFPELRRTPCEAGCSLYDRVTVMPHYMDGALVAEKPEQYTIVSPLAHRWETVVAQILNSTFVLSSSLHGIIVAEAFGIPARGFRIDQTEPSFKYADYYYGTGRQGFFMPQSVEEAYWLGPEHKPTFDAQKLLRAFPKDRFRDLDDLVSEKIGAILPNLASATGTEINGIVEGRA